MTLVGCGNDTKGGKEVKIVVNGKEQVLEQEKLTVTELLEINKVDMPDMVSVQLNGEFAKREEFARTQINDGDEIDFLYFMGGGK